MTRCRVCGASLKGRHPDARTCSASCRREAAPYRAVPAGRGDGPYENVDQITRRRSQVRGNRANRLADAA